MDALNHGSVNQRWLTVYKYCLMAAVAFAVVGFAKFIMFYAGQRSGGQLAGWTLYGIAQIGLFVFALWSLNRVGEKWVRTLHLSINGVAVLIVIIGFIQPYSYNILIQVGSIVVLPIGALVPWQLLFELQLDAYFRSAMSIASLMFAAYFFFQWVRLAVPKAEQQSDSLRKHRIGAGILTVLLALLLAIIWLAFAQQMSFLSGVMSGLGPSGASIPIPLPVIAIVLGIIIGGLMFCGKQGRGRPMVWLAAVSAPLLTFSVSFSPVFMLIILAISIYLIWVLRNTVPAKAGG